MSPARKRNADAGASAISENIVQRRQANPTAAAPEAQQAPIALTTTTAYALTVTADRIRAEHEAAQQHHRTAVEHALRCGDLLIEARKQVPHGEWTEWLSANTKIAETTARGYMRLAAMEPEKRQRVAVLTLRKALNDAANDSYKGAKLRRTIEGQARRELAAEQRATAGRTDVTFGGVVSHPDNEPVACDALDAFCPRAGREVTDTTRVIDVVMVESKEPRNRDVVIAPEPAIEVEAESVKATRKKPSDTAKIIDKATLSIARWFGQVAADDRKRFADAMRAVIAECEAGG